MIVKIEKEKKREHYVQQLVPLLGLVFIHTTFFLFSLEFGFRLGLGLSSGCRYIQQIWVIFGSRARVSIQKLFNA